MNHEPTNDAPRKGEYQRQIYDDAEVRKRTGKARNELVQRAKIRPTLKAVLAALWEFTWPKEICWPSQHKLMNRCGYGPNSRSAFEKKLSELQRMGIIAIERKRRPNGTWGGNVYRIDFGKLASLCDDPPPLPEAEERDYWTAPADSTMRPNGRPPCVQMDAYHASKQTHLSISKNNQRTPTEHPDENAEADGGGGGMKQASIRAAAPSVKPAGWWLDSITKVELQDAPTRERLHQAAITAGVLTPSKLDRLRFMAATKKIRDDQSVENPTGYLTWIVETAVWNKLTDASIQWAASQDNPGCRPMTKAEIRMVKGTGPTSNITPPVSANGPGP